MDNVLIPHRIVVSRKGGSTTYEFDEIRHNVEAPCSLFAVPADAEQPAAGQNTSGPQGS